MSKYILVVDDEPIVVEIAKRKLQDRGYEVATASNGEEALDSVSKRKPDLILLDIQMPKMNGYTFIIEMHKNPELVGVPVVVLTAYNEMEPLFKRRGVKAYLLKPLKLQDLLETVQKVIGDAPAAS